MTSVTSFSPLKENSSTNFCYKNYLLKHKIINSLCLSNWVRKIHVFFLWTMAIPKNNFGIVQFRALPKLYFIWLWFARQIDSNLYQIWHRHCLRYSGHVTKFLDQNLYAWSFISFTFITAIQTMHPLFLLFFSPLHTKWN